MTAKDENINRAERAHGALAAYEPKCPEANLSGDVLVDILCDLMHWSRENDEDFAAAYALAKTSFESEVAEEQNEDDASHEGGEQA